MEPGSRRTLLADKPLTAAKNRFSPKLGPILYLIQGKNFARHSGVLHFGFPATDFNSAARHDFVAPLRCVSGSPRFPICVSSGVTLSLVN
jgi:hypothetical protein